MENTPNYLMLGLHCAGMLASTLGFIYLVLWGWREVKPKKLLSIGLTLLILGGILAAATFKHEMKFWSKSMQEMMEKGEYDENGMEDMMNDMMDGTKDDATTTTETK